MQAKFLPYQFILLLLLLGYSCKKDDANSPDHILNISQTDIEVGNDAGYSDTVVIQSNIDWTISLSDGANAWLSVDPDKKATGDTTIITIKVIAGNTLPSQTATLTITPTGSNREARQINIRRKAYNLEWQKCYGDFSVDECFATAVLPNGQFVTTGTSYSSEVAGGYTIHPIGWTLRAGSDGARLWEKKAGYDVPYRSIAASADGGTVSLGNFMPYRLYYDADLLVVKHDALGNQVWSKALGGNDSESPKSIISTADGGYIVSGDTYSINGDFINNQGRIDLYVAKLNANGSVVWQKTFGGAMDDFNATVTACSDGGYAVVGYTESNNSGDVGINHGKQDLLVVKTDANGNKLWSKTIGGSSVEIASSVIGDTDGGFILMGYTTSTDGDVVGRSGIDNDTWVVKFTKDGQIGWQTCLGGSGNDLGMGMVRLPNGNIAISNNSNSTDRGITGNHGLQDIWQLG